MKRPQAKSGFKGDVSDAQAPALGAARIAGVKVVTIPLDDYAQLLADGAELARIRAARPKGLPRSPIERNPELRAFVIERFGKMELSDIATACAARFGKENSPSRSAIHRFLHRAAR